MNIYIYTNTQTGYFAKVIYILYLHCSSDECYFTIQVNTYIEDSIAQKDPLIKILRLVSMQSVCNNGLKQKVFDYYKREILQVESET